MSFDNFRMQRYLYWKTVSVFIIWLGPRADRIKQILGSDWLTKGGRLIARVVPPKEFFIEQKINKLLIDMACSVKMAKY